MKMQMSLAIMNRRFRKYYFIVLLLWILVSCADNNVQQEIGCRKANVTLLVSPYGLGDNGYNDCIADAVFAFSEQHGTEVHLLLPDNEKEAARLYAQYLADNENKDSSIIILGASSYEHIAKQTSLTLKGKGSRVLLVDGNSDELPDGVFSFIIDRYGVSYLVGAMSADFNALVFAAAPGYTTLESAIKGFVDGHTTYRDAGRASEVVYLADGEEGFAMPDSAYRVIARRMQHSWIYDEMIFPLLGGSGSGVLRCVNDDEFAMALVVGMDVDQTGRCSRVPFSVVIHVGDVICQYLEEWLEGEEWAHRHVLGLAEEAVNIIFTPNFFDGLDIWDERYENPEIFKIRYETYYEEALKKESNERY